MNSNNNEPLPVQTSEPELSKQCLDNSATDSGDRLTRHGLTIRRQRIKDGRWGKWTVRIKFQKKVHPLTLAETAKDSFDMAVRARREIQAGRWEELRAATNLRHVNQTTLADVFKHYRAYKGPDRPSDDTRELNINALTAILRESCSGASMTAANVDPSSISLLKINAELIWKWKEQKRKLADEAPDDERTLQILRSANSRLRQARSIFSDNEELRTYYRHNKLALPDCITAFCKEPPFSDCSKDEYHIPNDTVIAKTFEALEKLCSGASVTAANSQDLNIYKACWLALGFGLRKSEIAQAKNSWFVNLGGIIYCRGDELAKNKKFPEVRVQLGAWDKLRPHIENQDPNAYVLSGTPTDRCEDTFRRLSCWMKSLGWQTTHHIHEFRAWAGCQIAMASGNDIRTAQIFLRHASFATTERFYGHHLKIKLAEVQMTLPQVEPATFEPKLLPSIGG